MAQWLGQYTRNTHATRVEDSEGLLRHAVEAFRTAGPGADRAKKAKAVKRLADRLLWSRLKFLKARLATAQDTQSGAALAGREAEIAALERRHAAVREGGIEAILLEFRANDSPAA